MKRWIIGLAMLLGAPSALSAKPVDDYVYGPAPDWARYRELGEPAVKAALPDPAAWTISWPHLPARTGWGHKFKARGYATCGVLHATDPGARRPERLFGIVIDQDTVKGVDIGSGADSDAVSFICNFIVSRGVVHPAPVDEEQSEQSLASLGLIIRPMPEGAYVVSVTPDGLAARAGLAPGYVICRINGISVAGMGAAMAKVLGSDAPYLAIETVSGAKLTPRPAR